MGRLRTDSIVFLLGPRRLRFRPVLDRDASVDGSFSFYNGHAGIADITVGTSNTFAIGERAFGRLAPSINFCFVWWISGQLCDSRCTASYPTNVDKRMSHSPSGNDIAGSQGFNADTLSFGTFHPGITNFVFADGSVRGSLRNAG